MQEALFSSVLDYPSTSNQLSTAASSNKDQNKYSVEVGNSVSCCIVIIVISFIST
jgi:hypothetical protein